MDFEEAIAKHVQWKIKLRQCIDNTAEQLDPNLISQDNQCTLGQWIYGEALQYKGDPLYDKLKTEHAEFHKCAASVVRNVRSGDKISAEKIWETEYQAISRKVIMTLVQMRQVHESKE